MFKPCMILSISSRLMMTCISGTDICHTSHPKRHPKASCWSAHSKMISLIHFRLPACKGGLSQHTILQHSVLSTHKRFLHAKENRQSCSKVSQGHRNDQHWSRPRCCMHTELQDLPLQFCVMSMQALMNLWWKKCKYGLTRNQIPSPSDCLARSCLRFFISGMSCVK